MASNQPPEPTQEQGHPTSQLDGTISHVAAYNNRYVNEELCFYTRCAVLPDSAGHKGKDEPAGPYTLTVFLPHGMRILEYTPVQAVHIESIRVVDSQEGVSVTWQLAAGLRPAVDSQPEEVAYIEFETLVLVLPPESRNLEAARSRQGIQLTSHATLRDGQGYIQGSESATVIIRAQSALMNYLPEIYHGQDFLARFLMLFESFWKPMELQIDGSQNYYDPSLAPTGFLPWLASWIGFQLDPNLPELRQRQLMKAAFSLYRRRGTRQALIEYLSLFTGGQVKIIEHRAFNLKLGRASRLGAASALGTENRPHTFSAFVTIPRSYLFQFYGLDQNGAPPDEAESVLLEKSFKRQLENLINSQKPAHTGYQLTLEFTDDEELTALPAAGRP